jgi:PAS domain S-box-containing protein
MAEADDEREERVGEVPVAYRTVFEAAPDAILIVDAEGTVRDMNPQAVQLLGYTREELVGTSVERVVPESARAEHGALRSGYMKRPRARPMGIGLDLRARRSDGRLIPVEISLSPCPTPEEVFVIAVVRDVRERLRLRRLGAGTLEAAEEERRRIARELHDDTAQCLAALMIRLRILQRTEDEAVREQLMAEMKDELDMAVEGVRRISRGLRPPALEDVGVEAAIRSHLRTALGRSGMGVEVDMAPVEDLLDEKGQLVLYRVVQEAVSNVLRHARARTVRIMVDVSLEGERVVAVVEDDGVGFDPEEILLTGEGLGLLGMDERARLAGGRLEIQSRPGAGTRVEIRLPASPSGGVEDDGGKAAAEVADA